MGIAFTEELVSLNIVANDWQSVIDQLGRLMVENGYATVEYINAVLEREKVMPTGLPTQPIGVAMPHADCDHVLKGGIAVGVLTHSVEFGEMGTESSKIPVELVFFLSIEKPEQQIETLQNLVMLFRQKDVLKEIKEATRPEDVVALLNEQINTI